MANTKNDEKQGYELGYEDKLTLGIHRIVVWLEKDFGKKAGKQILVVLGLAVLLIAGWNMYKNDVKQRDAKAVEVLGQARNMDYAGKADSARVILEELLSADDAGNRTRAEAALLLGNIQFSAGNYDDAAKRYMEAINNASNSDLVKGGAMHGLASVYMQKKDWAKAESSLQEFLKYSERSSLPLASDAMWKLALVYSETGKKDQARSTCQEILKKYGSSRQASSARKLLFSLES